MGSNSLSSVDTQFFPAAKRCCADSSLQSAPLVPTRPGFDGYYDMRFSTFKSITRYLDIDFGELGRYVDKYDGQLLFTSNETEEEEYVGRLTAYKLHRRQMLEDGAGFGKVLESVNDEVHDLSCLFCPSGKLRGEWTDDQANAFLNATDIVLVTAIEVVKYSHRGFGLGLAMLDLAHTQLGGPASVMLIKPFPAQYKGLSAVGGPSVLLNGRLQVPSADCAFYAMRYIDAAIAKLCSYFNKVGMVQLADSGYLMRCSTASHPSIHHVCPHLFANINCGR